MLEIQKHTIIPIGKIFDSYIEVYEKELNYNVLLKHYGEFSDNLIRSFSTGMEEKMTQLGDKRHIVKRVFSILVEGLQNVHLHGGTDEEGKKSAFLIVAGNEEHYKILFGNIVEQEDRSSVKTYLGNINNHSDDELKKLYMTILRNGYLSKKGGAGLGIVTMRIKSSTDLHYQLYDLPFDKSFLVMEVTLERK